jgi:translation initiation factor 2D
MFISEVRNTPSFFVHDITILYTYKDQVLQRHRNIFSQDFEYHTQGDTTNYIGQWINTHQAVIQNGTTDATLSRQSILKCSNRPRPLTRMPLMMGLVDLGEPVRLWFPRRGNPFVRYGTDSSCSVEQSVCLSVCLSLARSIFQPRGILGPRLSSVRGRPETTTSPLSHHTEEETRSVVNTHTNRSSRHSSNPQHTPTPFFFFKNCWCRLYRFVLHTLDEYQWGGGVLTRIPIETSRKMFHKEGSSIGGGTGGSAGGNSSSNSNKGHNVKAKNKKSTPSSSSSSSSSSRRMDVPIRKSDRRHLFEQMTQYFESDDQPLVLPLLQTAVLQGTVSLRTIPFGPGSQKMNLYLRSAASSSSSSSKDDDHHHQEEVGGANDKDANDDIATTTSTTTTTTKSSSLSSLSSSFPWPYHASSQVIWMKLDTKGKDKGSTNNNTSNNNKHNNNNNNNNNTFLSDWETPSVALWAILTSVLSIERIQSQYAVIIPTDASKYLCRGADLMRPGMRSLPMATTTTATATTTTTTTSTPMTTTSTLIASPSPQQQQQRRRRRSMVAICTMENPQPFAVGRLHEDLWMMPDTTTTDSVKNDIPITMKGIGVFVWNCYGDDIWRHQLPKWTGSGNFGRSSSSSSTPADHTNSNVIVLGDLTTLDVGHYGNVGFVDGTKVYPVSVTTTTTPTTTIKALDDDDDDDNNKNKTERSVTPECSVEDEEELVVPLSDSSVEHTRTTDSNVAETNHPDRELPLQPVIVVDPFHTDTPVQGVHDDQSPAAAAAAAAAAAMPGDENKEKPSPEDILHQAVCQALLQLSLKHDLPMKVATFYASHVLPNRPPNTTIQLKQTKYKKFTAYLTEQVERGLLQVGPDPTSTTSATATNIKGNSSGGGNKGGGGGGKKHAPAAAAAVDVMACLIGFNARHDDLRQMKQQQQEAGMPLLSPNRDNSSSAKKLVLVTLYMIPTQWVPLLRLDMDQVKATTATSEERRGTGMLTGAEARRILEDYITREDIVDPIRPDQVRLDGPLTDALYSMGKKKKKKQAESSSSTEGASTDAPAVLDEETIKPPEVVLRKDLVQVWIDHLLPAHAIVEMPGSIMKQIQRGSPPKVEIEVTKRQAKKFMTRIRGLEEYGIDPVVFGKDVARRFASAVTTEANPDRAALKKKGHLELVMQGNLVDELEALLYNDDSLSSHGGTSHSDYSIPKGVIDVILRKGVPPRKKNTRK